jgi:hypothetical protein
VIVITLSLPMRGLISSSLPELLARCGLDADLKTRI